jgi:outer membrane protein OmpA-like peptidoglycan-associated protein
MKGARPGAVVLVAFAIATGIACHAQPVATPSPPSQDLFVLLTDPETGALGRARVSNQSGAVDLVNERDATQVVASRPPTPARALDRAEVQRIFGDALSALPPPSQSFNLYFRFDSDELTDAARALVPEILRVVRARPGAEVVVVGHTDTTGSSATNFELGLKRANTLRSLLVQAGLDASFIEVTSHGEADPLIPTADNTMEPLNRRVEVAVR